MGGIIHRTLTRRALLLASIWLGLAGTACKTPPPSGGKIRLVDDAGDTVRLPAPARRVVSLIPATTELLFAIGAGSSLVGRTSYCDYPPAAKAVPDLGDGIRPSIEAVLGQRPDLVVIYNSGQNAAVADRLRVGHSRAPAQHRRAGGRGTGGPISGRPYRA